jgi:hypothetical protein
VADFSIVSGDSATDVFALALDPGPDGGTDLFHFDGSVWSMATYQPQDLNSLFVVAPNDVYAAGVANQIVHYDGTSGTVVASARAIWGSGANDVFGVGVGGAIVHWDGTAWSPMASGTTATLVHVWGSGPTDVFATGFSGTIIHYDGSSWTPMVSGVAGSVGAVWGSGPTDVFASTFGAILHYDGVAWSTMFNPPVLVRSIWGSGPTDVFALGTGMLLHYDGQAWTAMDPGTTQILNAGYAATPADGFMVGDAGTIMHYVGRAWAPTTSLTVPMAAIWGTSARDLFAVGGSAISHFDGTTWSIMTTPPISGLRAVWGSGSNDVFAVGDAGTLVHYDGASWSTTAGITDWLYGVWGSGPSDVFAVGSTYQILHYDGSTWSPTPIADVLLAVWGSGPNDVFAAGQSSLDGISGVIYHFDGSIWSLQTTIATTLETIWGSGPNDVFAAGDGGVILHYDGGAWTQMASPTAVTIRGIGGSSATDLYAAGWPSTMLAHYDGTHWNVVTTGMVLDLDGVWMGSPRDLFVTTGSVEPLHLINSCAAIENCASPRDDDCDGLLDCADPDCAGDVGCAAGGACFTEADIACGAAIAGDDFSGVERIDDYRGGTRSDLGPETAWRFVAPMDGMVTVQLTALDADVDLAVLGAYAATGGCDPAQVLGTSQTDGLADESITFTAQAGHTYFLVADGHLNAAGHFMISVSCP